MEAADLLSAILIMNLRILATGGTFDKRYDPTTGVLGFGETHLHEIVARARVAEPVQVEVVMDSLDMVDEHRQRVLAACRAAPESALVVVHGTDTMVETARVLADARLPKTIVLTGAMVPYALADSDASFNLGAAVGFARSLAPGVWVAMNGLAHVWSNVRKNRERGVFEQLGD
jgi:L-asparaginase